MRYAEMEEFVNQVVFKMFGMRPLFEIQPSSFWKPLVNVCYQLLLLGLLIALQFFIYRMHLEQDFAGWFTSTTNLLTCVVILIQSLVSSRPLARLLLELREIETILGTSFFSTNASQNGPGARYSRTFYAVYAIGLLRGFFRTFLMIQLNVRSFWLALLLLTPALFILVRLNQQIQLTELIGTRLRCIADELSLLTGSADIGALGQASIATANTASGGHKMFRQRCHSIDVLQRTNCIFGRLQGCLHVLNDTFGWSTAAIVVCLFIFITFQLRYPFSPLPLYASLIDVLHAIICLFALCHCCAAAASKVADIERALLQPYHCQDSSALQDQINHWIVRLQLHRFVFTANGLYAIDYGLFCSTLAASATYIVIMFQFDQKSPEVAE
ncbi:uncharacterized protein LOC126572056 [Anopheles aquasalis]|uniref:uncharacterized protein LOC126572056 n=1 Tax=Anopheles aquasalis TaxID=42839 RepID=UPI00215B44C9|nr:uncharacterized protein LOC126572056 [Anopheles aquasalis]